MPAPFDRPVTHHLPALRRLTVSRVQQVTPSFARITLTAPDPATVDEPTTLDDFAASGPDDHVKVFFPDPTTGIVTVPLPRTGGPQHPPTGPVIARDYTPRVFRPRRGDTPAELDLDLLLHGDEGPASAWGARAEPGDDLVVGGPRASKGLPADARSVLLIGDESALPAVARWLELLPGEVEVTALLEVADSTVSGYLPDELRLRADVFWLFREHGAGQLPAALRGLGQLDDSTYVFGAGEAGALIPLRQHLRRELGLPANQVALNGYWKAGEAS